MLSENREVAVLLYGTQNFLDKTSKQPGLPPISILSLTGGVDFGHSWLDNLRITFLISEQFLNIFKLCKIWNSIQFAMKIWKTVQVSEIEHNISKILLIQ